MTAAIKEAFDRNEPRLASSVHTPDRPTSPKEMVSTLEPSMVKRRKLSHSKKACMSQPINKKKEMLVTNFPCHNCKAKFSSRCNLKRHLREVHETDNVNLRKKKVVCSVCKKVISHGYLNEHLLSVHNVVKGHRIKSQKAQKQSIKQEDGAGQTIADETLPDNLMQLMPTPDYRYKLIKYNEVESSSNSFTASFNLNVDSAAQFTEWRNKFQVNTYTQYTIKNTKPYPEDSNVLFKQYLKCLHNKYNGEAAKRRNSNTACPCRFTVTITKNPAKRRNVDNFPCLVDLSWCHNHPIKAGDVLRRHRVAHTTDDKIIKLFSLGHSVKSAMEYIEDDINDEIKDDELQLLASADRSLKPDDKHYYYIFKKIFKNKYGSSNSRKRLVEFVGEFNNEHGERSIMVEEYHGKSLIAICTPLMKRVHQNIQEAGEVMFVDSSRGIDRDGYKIFLFVTHSKAGGVPLAVGITPSESIEAMTRLFNLIKHVLPEDAFYSRGRDQGPQLVMTDDSAAEQGALQNVWPQTKQFLCQFHVLQNVWRYVMNEDNEILAGDRPVLFSLVKNMMCAQTHVDLMIQYELFLASPILKKYSNFREHICSFYENKRNKWCSAFRAGLPLKNKNTSNYVESHFRVLEDVVFRRERAYNIVQLTHFITEKLTLYYERRLLAYSSNRLSRQPRKITLDEEESINSVSDDVFEIVSSSDCIVSYTVNIAVCMCACPDGVTGKLCKHIRYVQSQTDYSSDTCSDQFADNRDVMYFVSRGCVPPAGCFDTLNQSTVTVPTTSLPMSSECTNSASSIATDNGFRQQLIVAGETIDTTDNFIGQQLIEAEEEFDYEEFDTTDDGIRQQLIVEHEKLYTNDDSITPQLIVAKEEFETTGDGIRQQLTVAKEEFDQVLKAIADKHCEVSPAEMLAAYRVATGTLKHMLHTIKCSEGTP